MKIQVQLFAAARDAVGQSPVSCDLADGATVGQLRDQLLADFPNLGATAKILLVAVNQRYADNACILSPDDSVACFPPVSGG